MVNYTMLPLHRYVVLADLVLDMPVSTLVATYGRLLSSRARRWRCCTFWRCANEAGDGTIVDILGHVYPESGRELLLIGEEVLGEGHGELCLADARGANEEERAGRTTAWAGCRGQSAIATPRRRQRWPPCPGQQRADATSPTIGAASSTRPGENYCRQEKSWLCS